MSDPREASLPKWAQQELARLRSRVETLEKAPETLEDSDTFIVGSGDRDQAVGRGARISFVLGPDPLERIQVYADAQRGLLVIQGNSQLSVLPVSGNNIAVRTVESRFWKGR